MVGHVIILGVYRLMLPATHEKREHILKWYIGRC